MRDPEDDLEASYDSRAWMSAAAGNSLAAGRTRRAKSLTRALGHVVIPVACILPTLPILARELLQTEQWRGRR
jgi:hypothetical protein